MKKILVSCLTLLLLCAAIEANADSYGGAYGGGSAAGGGVSVAADCNVAAYFPIGKLCQSSANGKLYKGTGAAVVEIASGTSGTVDVSGTPTNHQWPGWTDEDTLKGFTVTASKPVCSDANGDPAVCAGTEGVWQTAITFGTGTEAALASAPDASGGLLSVAGLGSVTQAYNATLTALAAQTESQGALQYYTADATPAVLAKGTAYQLLQMNSGATAPEWTSSLSISALNLTSATSSIPWVVGTASAPTTEGQAYWNSSTDTLTVGNGSTATALASTTYKPADLAIASQAAGDVLYFDGTNWVRLAADTGKYLKSGASAVSWDTPTGIGDFKADGSVPFTAALVPNAANTVALGSTSAEIADIYLGDGAIIYGQNDQSNTITSSATGWSFAKPITIADASNDNYIKVTNNTSREPTSSVNELYPEGNVWKMNSNGVESTIQKQVAQKLAVFTWDGGASALTAAAGTKRCAFVPAAATLTGLYASTQAESTSDITFSLHKDAFAAGSHATTAMISGTNAVTIASAGTVLNVNDTTLTNFTTAISAGDQICAVITATDTTTWLQLTLYGTY